MKEKKYILIGGYIISKNDGDRHFISATRLCELYKLNPQECYFLSENPMIEYELKSLPKGLKVLQPRYDGNYNLITPTHLI
jgi:hypothetical protein